MNVTDDVCQLIGNTPLLELKNYSEHPSARILAKMECCNPTSIKDRAVLQMIRGAMQAGKITEETEVVEASSGNTAIAIASLGAILGYKTRIYMSESCSIERQQVICAYGAKVILTPAVEHTRGARERAIAYCKAHPEKTFFLNQHGNAGNGMAHELTTGPELWEQTGGNIDAVVIGLGTSGTFDGLSRFFKQKNPDIRIVGFEPAGSPVYSGKKQGKHKITGVGPGFITDNFKRSQHNLDELILVEDDAAFEAARQIAKREGILVGPTSGASAWVAGQLAERPDFKDKTIVCFMYDTGERYLSTPGLFPTSNIDHET
ncbi:MAG: cysteine synthase family protein [Opitutales bacterium]|jgi:cysteine synthase|nr:cysteine synthase family protein [Opitutales bacterium]